MQGSRILYANSVGHLDWILEDQKLKKQSVESVGWLHEVFADNKRFHQGRC